MIVAAKKPRLRLEDISKRPLDDVFLVISNPPVDTKTACTLVDLYKLWWRRKLENRHIIKQAPSLRKISEARFRLQEIDGQLASIIEQARKATPISLRYGRWVAFGRLGNRLTVIPRVDWSGDLDW